MLQCILQIFIFCLFFDQNSIAGGAEQWRQIPLRTIEQKNASLLGGEGFQQSQAISFAPSNPAVVYMSTDTSQVWKSSDNGFSWQLAGKSFPANGAASIFVHPTNENILLAAGYYGASYERAYMNKGRVEGIFRSEDGGQAWHLSFQTAFFEQAGKGQLFVAIKFKEQELIYCGTWEEGLLVSTDKGRSWTKTKFLQKNIRDIELCPDDPGSMLIACEGGLFRFSLPGNLVQIVGVGLPSSPLSISSSSKPLKIVYAVCGDGNIYISKNNGQAFRRERPVILPVCHFSQVDANPLDGTVAIATSNQISGCDGIWTTQDGGSTWLQVMRTKNDDLMPRKRLGQWYVGPVAFHPINPLIALAGINGSDTILRTKDGGLTWNYSASGFCGGRMESMAFPKKNHIVMTLTDFGIWESINRGETFTELKTGRQHGLMSSSSIAVQDKVMIASLGGWNEKGIILSFDNGRTWQHIDSIEKGQFKSVAIHKKKQQIFYAGSYRSLNGGVSWEKLTQEIVAVYPGDNNIIYALQEEFGGCYLLRSSDRGDSWVKISKLLLLERKFIHDIDVHPTKPDTIFFATSRGVAILRNGEWYLKESDSGITKDLFGCYVQKIAIDPLNPSIIYAGKRAPGVGPSNGVFRSNDGGDTWESIQRNLPDYLDVFGLEVSPYDGSVYLGTSLGTFVLLPEISSFKQNLSVELVH
jgi:photosystem II stability/assembly factor-like uncharacterized protein